MRRPGSPNFEWIVVKSATEMDISLNTPNPGESDLTGYSVTTKQMDIWSSNTVNTEYNFGINQTIKLTDMNANQSYKVSVRARNKFGLGERSNEALVTIMSGWSEPDAVMVTSNPQGYFSDQYTLRWKLTLQGIGKMPVIGYRFVLRKETGEKWPWNDVQGEVIDVYQDDTSYSFLHLEPDTEYSVDIKALNVMKNAIPQKGLPAYFTFRTNTKHLS